MQTALSLEVEFDHEQKGAALHTALALVRLRQVSAGVAANGHKRLEKFW